VVEPERVDVEAVSGHHRRQVAEGVPQRPRVEVGVDEHERPPGVHLNGHEAELVRLEAGLVLAARRRAQGPVEPVGPGVVGALDGAPPLRLVHEDRPAVAADVKEGPQPALAVKRHDHR
jgi:hypothetical protein